MPEEPKQINCPNCLGQAIKEGNKITCETCDAIFTFTKTGGARVKEIGKISDHEERISRLENLLPGQEQEPKDKSKNDEPEEDSILG